MPGILAVGGFGTPCSCSRARQRGFSVAVAVVAGAMERNPQASRAASAEGGPTRARWLSSVASSDGRQAFVMLAAVVGPEVGEASGRLGAYCRRRLGGWRLLFARWARVRSRAG